MRRTRLLGIRPGLFVLAAALLPGCVQPIDNLRNLEAIHTDDGYATEVPHRGFWWRTRRGLGSTFGQGPPKTAQEEVEDPVGFCLENLADLQAQEEDLDDLDRCAAVALLCDWAMQDPTRVVQAACLDTSLTLLTSAEFPRVPTAEAEQEEWEALIQSLQPLVEAAPGDIEALVARQGQVLAASVRRLQEIAPRDATLARQLTRFSVLASRQSQGYGLGEALLLVAQQIAAEAAFQTAASRVGDASEYVQSASIRLMLALDLPAATSLVARNYPLIPSVRVDLLRDLATANCTLTDLDPLLRQHLHRELISPDSDASVRHWARQGIARLLELSPSTPIRELASRWEILIESPLPAEGS